jgi:sortase A
MTSTGLHAKGLLQLERAAWIAGVTLIAAWGGLRAYGTLSSARLIAEFDTASPEHIDTSLWSDSRRRHYEESLAQEAGPTIAVLKIERVGLEVPVLDGTGEVALNRGVGHIDGTGRPGDGGNVGIAGHRDGFFRALKDVGAGDVIELRTPLRTDSYVVRELRVVPPEDLSVLDPTPVPSLTLVTCYPFYYVGPAPHRYVVRAEKR